MPEPHQEREDLRFAHTICFRPLCSSPRATQNYLSLCVYAGRHGQQTLIGSLYISRPASLGSLEHPPVCVVCGAYGGAWDTHTHPCIGSRRARPPTCRRSVWCARALVAVSSGFVTGACACLANLMDPLLYNQSSGGERATSRLRTGSPQCNGGTSSGHHGRLEARMDTLSGPCSTPVWTLKACKVPLESSRRDAIHRVRGISLQYEYVSGILFTRIIHVFGPWLNTRLSTVYS